MKKFEPVQTISMLANIGVIAGIVFLGLELRQNNSLMSAQARFNRLSLATGSQTILAENPNLAGFLMRANNGEALTPEEELRLESYFRRVFTNMEWTYREIPESLVPLERWRDILANPYPHRFWAANKDEFGQDFIEFIEENVVNR